MHSFLIQVTAYFGSPKVVNGFYIRSETSRTHVIVDAASTPEPVEWQASSDPVDDDIDDLINAFQDEFNCKVGLGQKTRDGAQVFYFDIFEPSWPEQLTADIRVNILAQRLVQRSNKGHS